MQRVESSIFSIIEHFFEDENNCEDPIGKNTIIGENVIIGKNVKIGTNCSIIRKCPYRRGTTIYDNIAIRNYATIGGDCYIQSLCVIGEDGFGYSEDSNHKKVMVKHHGGVYIGSDYLLAAMSILPEGLLMIRTFLMGLKLHHPRILDTIIILGRIQP